MGSGGEKWYQRHFGAKGIRSTLKDIFVMLLGGNVFHKQDVGHFSDDSSVRCLSKAMKAKMKQTPKKSGIQKRDESQNEADSEEKWHSKA